MTRSIAELQKAIHKINLEKGWWELPSDIAHICANNSITAKWIRLKMIMEKLALLPTEISEATEELRNSHGEAEIFYAAENRDLWHTTTAHPDGLFVKPEGFPIELADLAIRLFDLAEYCQIDLGACIEQKIVYNQTRSHRHGGKLA